MLILRHIATRLYSAWCIGIFFVVIFFQMLGFVAVSWLPSRRRTLVSYQIGRATAIAWMRLCGYTIMIEGEEKISRERTYMFVANHSNFLDLPMTAYIMTYYYKSLAKKELKYIPIFGYLIQTSAVLVDRSSAESRKRSVEIVVELLRSGLSFLIFPEGTRNKTARPLKEFFSGAFRMAILAQVPVQPMVYLDHHQLQPVGTYRFHAGRLRIRVLDAIETTGMREEDTEALQQQVYRLIESTILTEDKDYRK